MFREGQYLEVIKTPDGCVATAIVTIKEKTIEYKNKAMKTNKWPDLQDWTTLYGVLRKAIMRNNENRSRGKFDTTETKKSTRQLEITYKFEDSDPDDKTSSMPTLRVTVESTKDSQKGSSKSRTNRPEVEEKKSESKKRKAGDLYSDNYSLEEYVPPALPSSTRAPSAGLKYVPSRKSMLMRMRKATNENEYDPTSENVITQSKTRNEVEVSYVPNYVDSLDSLAKLGPETYEPCGVSDLSEVYVPSSKGARAIIEEYQPDLPLITRSGGFDESYVPSSTCGASDLSEAYIPSSKGARANIEEYQPGLPLKTRLAGFDESYVPSSTCRTKPESKKRSRKSLEGARSKKSRLSNDASNKYTL